jgi:hypothetical protein
MHNVSRLAGIFACAATLAATGCAGGSAVTPNAQAANAARPSAFTHPVHLMPVFNGFERSVNPDATNATYGGGRLLYKPKMYIIFWGFKKAGDPDKVAKLLESYQKSIGGSAYNNIYTQYNGAKKYITNPKNQSGSFWMDDKDAIPTSPTDGQVAAESELGVKHFGYNSSGSYVVVTAHDHSTSGFGTDFCAYHSSITDSKGELVSYTNLPYIPDAGQSCGANYQNINPPPGETTANEGTSIVEGHEYGESITDPDPFSGWTNPSWSEIGDICAWTDIQVDPYGKKKFVAQPMWSNATSSCVHSYSK